MACGLAILNPTHHLTDMIGAVVSLFKNLGAALGLRKAPPTPAAGGAAPIEHDDFVARYGLAHGEAPDPISNESRVEIERMKSFRRGPSASR